MVNLIFRRMKQQIPESQNLWYERPKSRHQSKGFYRLVLRWGSYAFLLSILASCAGTSDVVSERGIQKRKYRKGYFVAKPSKAPELQQSLHHDATPSSYEAQTTPHPAVSSELPETPLSPVSKSETSDLATTTSAETTAHESTRASKTGSAVSPKTTEKNRSLKLLRQGLSDYQTQAPIDLHSSDQVADDTELLLYVILAVILPPLAIFLLYGVGTEFIISLVLTILLWLPGVIYALIHVLRRYG